MPGLTTDDRPTSSFLRTRPSRPGDQPRRRAEIQRRATGITLQRRQDGQPAHIIAISWQAQQRLHRVWRRLAEDRGKRRTIVAVAVARELAGFCWALALAD